MRSCLILLLTLLSISACAPKIPEGAGEDFRKKLYYDANLAFSVAIPEDWQRQATTPPQLSKADYAITWHGKIEPDGQVEMTTVVLPAEAREANLQTSLEAFSKDHPGFTITARLPLSDQLGAPENIFGHTSSRLYRIVHIPSGDRSYRFAFSTPPENFDSYQPLFDLIIMSFQPVQ